MKLKTLKYTKAGDKASSSHTATFSSRVLPHSVVNEAVVQKGEVIVKRYWSTASLQGCVFERNVPVANEVQKDFVVVGVGLFAGPRAVPEYHLLTGVIAQTQVCHI